MAAAVKASNFQDKLEDGRIGRKSLSAKLVIRIVATGFAKRHRKYAT
jgi:hypothetical protein